MTTADRGQTDQPVGQATRPDGVRASDRVIVLAASGRGAPASRSQAAAASGAIAHGRAKRLAFGIVPPAPALAVLLPLVYAGLTIVFVAWLAVFSILFGATMLVDLVRRSVRRVGAPVGALESPAVR